MEMILYRIEHGEGRPGDLDLLASLPPRINMRTLCPLGDAACGPVESALQKFRARVRAPHRRGALPGRVRS